jgi:hypothetical protein
MLLMRANPLLGQGGGRGVGPGNRDFFGPQMALAFRLNAISQGPKKYQFPGPSPLPPALVMDAARIKSITHKSYVHK